jgi:hypothetical protein
VAAVWAFLVWERIGLARAHDNSFTVHGAQSVSDGGVGARDLMALCLEENDRRFAGYDERLLRPATVPRLVRAGLRLMRPFVRRE